jgi:hypothetical protein
MAHIQILLSILALVGIALTIERKANITFSESLLYAVIFTSIILYFGALQNYLEITTTMVRVIGWLGLIICLLKFKKRQLKTDEIYILLSAAGFYAFCQTAPYSIFPFVDDYSHWGRMSRYIAENNRLIINSDLIGVKDYPPIAALFHYFFTHFSGYQDNIAIFSNGLLIIIFSAPILIPVSQYKAEEKKIAFILASLSLYSLFWIFGLGLHSLWADLLIGISFGIGLNIYFNREGKNKQTALFAVIPILLYTVQIKQIGLLFSMFTLAIIGIDYLKYDKDKLVKKLMYLVLILAALLLFEWTWKNHLNTQGIARVFKSDLSLAQIFSAFNPGTATERENLTVSRFIDYFFFTYHLSTFWFMASLLLLGGIVAYKKINILELNLTRFGLAYLFFAVYSIVLLILYLFSFSAYEGPRLASIDRYILTYILGLLMFLGGALINISKGDKTKKFKIFLIITSIVIILPNCGRMLLDSVRVIRNTYPTHTAGVISQISKYIKEKTPENSKIYIIWSNGSNDESVIFSYYLMPRKNNTDCIFVRPPDSVRLENDIWSCLMSIDQFKEKISSYDYLILANPSEEFLNYFVQKLNIEYDTKQPMMFKIVHENELRLEIVK